MYRGSEILVGQQCHEQSPVHVAGLPQPLRTCHYMLMAWVAKCVIGHNVFTQACHRRTATNAPPPSTPLSPLVPSSPSPPSPQVSQEEEAAVQERLAVRRRPRGMPPPSGAPGSSEGGRAAESARTGQTSRRRPS